MVTEFPTEFTVEVDGEVFNVRVSPVGNGAGASGGAIRTPQAPAPAVQKAKERPAGAVVSGMAGLVLSLEVAVGDAVKAGDQVATVEVMKMRRRLACPHAGVVKEILVEEGDVLEPDNVVMVVQ